MKVFEVIPQNPDQRIINQCGELLKDGELLICPTDTIYALVCSLNNREGILKICQIMGKRPERANLSILCSDLKNISDYTLQFSKGIYKVLNRNLPGPFTFILRANSKVPKLFLNKRKTIGIRVPANKITAALLEYCGEPLVCASLHHPNDPEIVLSDPQEIKQQYQSRVEYLIDGGTGGIDGSWVIDCTHDEQEILREGPGELVL